MNYTLSGTPALNGILQRPKAILYCRVSTKGQTTRGDGLGSQEATCRRYAERMGYDVIEVFLETMTGRVAKRPAMAALLKFLRAHKKDGLIVIVDSANRFSRDIRGHWDLRDLLAEAGGKLESPNMKFGDSPAERFAENVTIAAAQYQAEDNALQVVSRQQGRLLNGYWPFTAPRGMQQVRTPDRGKVLMRKEPAASVLEEGLQAFADGRIRSQAEFARWLNGQSGFGSGSYKITDQHAHLILTNVLYAGMVERLDWGIERKKGKHDGLISYETFERIQARLNGKAYAQARPDVSGDFPLRGSVRCAHCGGNLTSCWSRSKTGAEHPYYMCFAKGCPRYRKSIRRDKIEGEFVALLEQLTPKPELFHVTKAMFKNAWAQRSKQADAIARTYTKEIADADRKIAALVDRVVDTSSPAVMAAFEKRITEIEHQKLVLMEKQVAAGDRKGSFEELFELAFAFLASPSKIWRLGQLEARKLVLRLVFPGPLDYAPENGFRTPETTMPFSISRSLEKLAERKTGPARLTSGEQGERALADRRGDRRTTVADSQQPLNRALAFYPTRHYAAF